MNGHATLRLDGELTIQRAQELHGTLRAALEQPGPALQLDLAGVDAFDSAGVQLLLATRHSLLARERTLRLDPVSDCVLQGLRCFGLEALFRAGPGGGA